MTNRMLLNKLTPVTQRVESVVALLNFLGKASNPLPDAVELPGIFLILNNKKDAFYVTSARSCSCPSAAYRPGQKCKHQRRYFPGTDAPGRVKAETSDSIRPSGKWPGGFNGPVDIDTINAKIALDQKEA
ncbi:MAG TPA: hypothetical protein PLZ59_10065 [Methanothrix soehngenii]|nr:hypothetical protein [Methanothrix soehngenii]